ncbi:MAG TPA: VOC family protein [Spirochaetia bacterium]|nr:VOC family protein [Spirochaetia bacterium]
MKPRINVITLAINDLEKANAFYRDGLGFPTKGIIGAVFKGTTTEPSDAVGFFELGDGLILALYPRSDLAKDSKLPPVPASSLEFSLDYLAESRYAGERGAPCLKCIRAIGAHTSARRSGFTTSESTRWFL